VDRLWSRVGIRAASVGLLVAGVIGGVHLGQLREQQLPAGAQITVRADGDDLWLLKARQNEHSTARAWERAAGRDAADEAAGEARSAAARARSQEKKAIARKAAESRGYAGPIPASCQEYAGNRKIGCAMMLQAGFPIAEFPCLEKLWTKESGWNEKAANPSGAYGIPQALPGSKMGSAGSDWRSNPATQIKWGLGYVKGRYDTPCGAWNYFQNNGSY